MDPNEQGQLKPSAVVLLVIGEPFSEEQKTLILDEIIKGFRCWDVEETGININGELAQIASKASMGVEYVNANSKPGERFIQHQSDHLALDILVNPLIQTVKNSIKKLLIAPTPTKYIIYAGHVFQGSGAWVLQDDTFTFSSLAQVFRNIDVENALKQSIEANLTIHTLADSNWGSSISKADFTNNLRIQLNPSEKLDNIHGVQQFIAYVGGFVRAVPITSLLQASEQFGNISFTRPTLYIFPGCQGDSALFGIRGFNLLVNGGYNKRACFWDFTRHLDRVDAMLMTHLGTDNIFGLKTVLQRKCLENIHPHIGYLYFNALEKLNLLPPEQEGDGDSNKKSSLLINLTEEANKIVQMAKQLGISPHPCSRSATAANCEPVNLYHKLGHGSLDMYVLNPVTDSKELKELYHLWSKQACNFGTSGQFLLQNVLSVCALLVWKPYNFDEKIVRILFPGNSPQYKIIEGFEKMKSFGFLKQASCTARDLMKPQSVKKPAAGPSKPAAGAKGPTNTPASGKSETGTNLNATKIELPRKDSKIFPARVRTSSPTKPSKIVREDINGRNSKFNEKHNADEKEGKLKPSTLGERATNPKKSPRQISAPSPVRGSSTLSKASSPTKSTSSTRSSSTHESFTSVKSPIKTKASEEAASAQETKPVIAVASADQAENEASTFSHVVDQWDLKLESQQDQLTPKDKSETIQASDNSISEARDAVGSIDAISASLSPAFDRQKIENIDIYSEKKVADYADIKQKYEMEEEEKPQALPEPAVVAESPCLESTTLSDYSSQFKLPEQELPHLIHDEKENMDNESKAPGDPEQGMSPSAEPSQDGHHDCPFTSPEELVSEFETPIFTNDEPESTISCKATVEHNIQYGIDNLSNGRDMGGIQEVDEDENEDNDNVEREDDDTFIREDDGTVTEEGYLTVTREDDGTITRDDGFVTRDDDDDFVTREDDDDGFVTREDDDGFVTREDDTVTKDDYDTKAGDSHVTREGDDTVTRDDDDGFVTREEDDTVTRDDYDNVTKAGDSPVTREGDDTVTRDDDIVTREEDDTVVTRDDYDTVTKAGDSPLSREGDDGIVTREVDDTATKEGDIQNKNSLDRETLREMGIYDDEDYDATADSTNGFEKDSIIDDNEAKMDPEDEEELGSDGRTSAERQFEDVDDENQQIEEDEDEGIEDEGNSYLPEAFDKDSSPDFDTGAEFEKQDRAPKTEQGITEIENINGDNLTHKINGDHTFYKVNGDVNPFFGCSAEGDHTQNQDGGGESENESASSFDPVAQWGNPMGLPSPPPADRKQEGRKGAASPSSVGTAKLSRSGTNDSKFDGKKRPITASGAAGKGSSRPGSAIKRAAANSSRTSPLNTKISALPQMTPFYVDLTYVPNHADSAYSDAEFFKRVRARYYVISALSPNPQVLDTLLEAKATWEQKDLEVTIIPTYDNDTLRHWIGLNSERLQELRVDVKPAVNRCTVQLQDLETSLPAYRLEI